MRFRHSDHAVASLGIRPLTSGSVLGAGRADQVIEVKSTTTWAQFVTAMPDLASFGRQRLEGRIAYLATLRPDGSPRVHPVSPFLGKSHLLVYMEPTSPKVLDMRRDARYAMHCGVEDNSGGQGEFFVRGRAVEVDDAKTRGEAFEEARRMGYTPQDRHVLFELRIEEVLATVYEDGKPKRTKWETD